MGFRMKNISFPQPISIFVGLGFPREVGDVLEAYKLLNEWPEGAVVPRISEPFIRVLRPSADTAPGWTRGKHSRPLQ